jgi:two-component system, OmpR family, aerobic respiration control sensor histidine kinase ArcB
MVEMKMQMHVALSDIEKLLNDIPGHVYWKDHQGMFVGCNRKQAHSMGFNHSDELAGKNDFDLLSYEEAEIIRSNDILVMKCGKPLVLEEIAEYDGKKRIFLSHKVPIKNAEGGSIGILGVSLDITHQKELEAQLVKSNRMLKKLLDRQKILEAELCEKNYQLEEALRGTQEKVVA